MFKKASTFIASTGLTSCGFRQASYFRDNSPNLAAETADYVPKVMAKWGTYTDSLRTYNASRRFESEEIDTTDS